VNHLLHVFESEFRDCWDGYDPVEEQGDSQFGANWATRRSGLVGERELEERGKWAIAVVQTALEIVHAATEVGTVVAFCGLGEMEQVFSSVYSKIFCKSSVERLAIDILTVCFEMEFFSWFQFCSFGFYFAAADWN